MSPSRPPAPQRARSRPAAPEVRSAGGAQGGAASSGGSGGAPGKPAGESAGRPAGGRTSARARASTTSAEKFARRVAGRRRKRNLAVVGVLALLGVLAWVLLGSPWLRVRNVQISGTVRVAEQEIRSRARSQVGTPIALADPQRLAEALVRIRLVKHVRVERAWPDTLKIVITERIPVAAVPADGRYYLLDADGVLVQTAARVPKDLPVIQADLATNGVAAMHAALAVLHALPADLRARIASVGAGGPNSVWLVLLNRARVQWGGPDQADLKAAVLTVLLKQRPAAVYDVSAPDVPAVSGSH